MYVATSETRLAFRPRSGEYRVSRNGIFQAFLRRDEPRRAASSLFITTPTDKRPGRGMRQFQPACQPADDDLSVRLVFREARRSARSAPRPGAGRSSDGDSRATARTGGCARWNPRADRAGGLRSHGACARVSFAEAQAFVAVAFELGAGLDAARAQVRWRVRRGYRRRRGGGTLYA